MFTQFFGNYLLNKRLVEPQQLAEALSALKTTRVKLGVLAINAGYMTAAQVEKVHAEQQRIDKRIGEIAVDMGFMTLAQVDELFSSQSGTHLLLGQALVDRGAMTNAEFETALNAYKAENSLTDSDFKENDNAKIHTVIKEFYRFDGASDELMVEYIDLLFKNIVRFIGDDFTPLNCEKITSYEYTNASIQKINGQFSCTSAIDAEDAAYIAFASRYAGEELDAVDEMADASAGEFLNLHNGLFAVNVSNDSGVELVLEPQNVIRNEKQTGLTDTYKIPLAFPFGTVTFILGS
ncbi:MAG: chemotaxis protein CheX [Oscillospiraceae bacterium]|nr:chemotaxis protein CheX [Oscillospiraceae bacterium]